MCGSADEEDEKHMVPYCSVIVIGHDTKTKTLRYCWLLGLVKQFPRDTSIIENRHRHMMSVACEAKLRRIKIGAGGRLSSINQLLTRFRNKT